ncbi:hypothetical protein THOM_1306 [Trachipleistophora hominis]|uniref:Uncharacterized protein n=1 Tax=Trachipleistophora hominis TaxID=72359 RepID=L7JYD2_TRAHO|nr:hypothetical protein THOM_1306 [Trachipleistophora hominis]
MMKPKEHVHKELSTGNEHMKRMCESVRRESSTEITSECVGRLSIPVKRSRRFFYRRRGDER